MKRLQLLTIFYLFGFLCVNAQYGSDSSKVNDDTFSRFRIGGYGEILYQQMDFGPDRYSLPDGAPATNTISLRNARRAITTMQYR